eukprot:CAMPEP_0194210266 /NCGR_PEP_ID=MMETSP0156-20130528/8124_1 /TAXON_ID=33649 /ORGANISM="Thalassionema nitzschioides, Strain L26-B" /LENGTH=294 /DNA_ID=CAMNT_0038937591 /DNA_START=764 /DNA_END=1648 /DNA_ORIENTATION=-
MSSKALKTKLVRRINSDMQQAGYRFLKREDKSSLVWNDIKEADAHEKISHALRDRVRELRKPLRKSANDEESNRSLITAMANVLKKQTTETSLALRQLEALRNSVTKKSLNNNIQPISYESGGLSSKLSSGNLHHNTLTNVLNKAPESWQNVRIQPTRRISLLGLDDEVSRTNSSRRVSLSIPNVGQVKTANDQARRSSMVSLFGGLADQIADVQTDTSNRRNSLVEDFYRINAALPHQCITLPTIGENLSQVSRDEELARLGRRLSLLGYQKDDVERRFSMLSSFSEFTFQEV